MKCSNKVPKSVTHDVTRGRKPGAVARSEACPLGMQAAPISITTSGTFFREDLVMKVYPYKLWFLCPLTIQKSVSQKSQNGLLFIKKIYHKTIDIGVAPFLQGET